MVNFEFSGNLRRYISEVSLNVKTIEQGLRLLMAQLPGFRRDYQESTLHITINGKHITQSDYAFNTNRALPDGAIVKFMPVVEGAISGTAALVISLVVTAASVAYSLYMTSQIKKQSSADTDSTSITNNSFTSAENRIGQGNPVPLLLGYMCVGSNVISLGLDTSNDPNWTETVS